MSRIEDALARSAGFERRLNGLAVGAGVAIGPVFGTVEAPTTITRHRIAAADIEAERARLDAAVVLSRKQLGKLRARLHVLPEDTQAEIAPLLDAYVQMLGPSRLLRGSRTRIAESLRSAEQAVTDEAEAIAAALLAANTDDLPRRPTPRRRGAGDRAPAGAKPDAGAVSDPSTGCRRARSWSRSG